MNWSQLLTEHDPYIDSNGSLNWKTSTFRTSGNEPLSWSQRLDLSPTSFRYQTDTSAAISVDTVTGQINLNLVWAAKPQTAYKYSTSTVELVLRNIWYSDDSLQSKFIVLGAEDSLAHKLLRFKVRSVGIYGGHLGEFDYERYDVYSQHLEDSSSIEIVFSH